jgi:NADPH2:quinone reductase
VRELGGADVILELVGALHMRDNLGALAYKGRIVIVGARPGDEATITMRDLMSRRARVIGTTLRTRPLEEKGVTVQEFARRVVPFLATGRVRPLIDRVFPLSSAADALDYVRTPGKLGKVLLATAEPGQAPSDVSGDPVRGRRA